MELIMFVQNMEINYGRFLLFVDIVPLRNFAVTVKKIHSEMHTIAHVYGSYNLTTEVNQVGVYLV